MEMLTKRNLLLGNLVLGLIFALAAYAAARPLFTSGVKTVPPQEDQAVNTGGATLDAEKEHHRSMLSEYPHVILGNNIFVPKTVGPIRPPPNGGRPIKEPPWELVGTWNPDGLGRVWEATIKDKSKKPGYQELVVREGDRFVEYMVVITEVTREYVRYEIRDEKHDQVVERFLPPEAARLAVADHKEWSPIITMTRRNLYTVDMTAFVAECEEIAGPDGDWVEALINTVKTEPYMPSGEGGLRGYKVVSFTAQSPLDDLGILKQDILVGLVKKPITSKAQARELLAEALEQDVVSLVVNRLGKTTYIVIKLNRF